MISLPHVTEHIKHQLCTEPSIKETAGAEDDALGTASSTRDHGGAWAVEFSSGEKAERGAKIKISATLEKTCAE